MRIAVLAVLALGSLAAAETRHTVVPGEHLWGLAKQYYKNPHRWRVIHEANTPPIKEAHWIYPGQVFVIPDVPEPEPTQASAPVAAAPEPEQAPPPAPPPAPAGPKPEEAGMGEDLPTKMPPALTTFTTERLKAPKDWKEDGRVAEFEGREIMAAEGDVINAKFSKGAAPSVGDRLTVYRPDAPREMDEDPKGLYLHKVGLVEVKEKIGQSEYRLLILKSADSLQLDDLLKREGL